MTAKRLDDWTDKLGMERNMIRVDLPQSHSGVTAALRRAFEAAASEPCDRDFEALLARLN